MHDYILEMYEIEPRDFNIQPKLGTTSLHWTSKTCTLKPFTCAHWNGPVHVHDQNEILAIAKRKPNTHAADDVVVVSDDDDNDDDDDYLCESFVVCCNEVDIIALKYLNATIFGPQKEKLIASLHSWLPAATFHHVNVIFSPPHKCIKIDSYFEPTYLFYAYYIVYESIEYNYYIGSNIEIEETYTKQPDRNITIKMASTTRARSRSRSSSPSKRRRRRSPSAGAGSKRRRNGSRRRRRSPSASRRRAPASRARSRSRSRSRSR